MATKTTKGCPQGQVSDGKGGCKQFLLNQILLLQQKLLKQLKKKLKELQKKKKQLLQLNKKE
jgi:hypothetical protein